MHVIHQNTLNWKFIHIFRCKNARNFVVEYDRVDYNQLPTWISSEGETRNEDEAFIREKDTDFWHAQWIEVLSTLNCFISFEYDKKFKRTS